MQEIQAETVEKENEISEIKDLLPEESNGLIKSFDTVKKSSEDAKNQILNELNAIESTNKSLDDISNLLDKIREPIENAESTSQKEDANLDNYEVCLAEIDTKVLQPKFKEVNRLIKDASKKAKKELDGSNFAKMVDKKGLESSDLDSRWKAVMDLFKSNIKLLKNFNKQKKNLINKLKGLENQAEIYKTSKLPSKEYHDCVQKLKKELIAADSELGSLEDLATQLEPLTWPKNSVAELHDQIAKLLQGCDTDTEVLLKVIAEENASMDQKNQLLAWLKGIKSRIDEIVKKPWTNESELESHLKDLSEDLH